MSQQSSAAKTILTLLGISLMLYVVGYGIFRQINSEVWEKDGRSYVIFPENKIYLYYAFRPLSIIDHRLTGMNFHIGRHQ